MKSIIKPKAIDCPEINLGFQIERPNAPIEEERSDIPSIFRVKRKGYLARIIETQEQRRRDHE